MDNLLNDTTKDSPRLQYVIIFILGLTKLADPFNIGAVGKILPTPVFVISMILILLTGVGVLLGIKYLSDEDNFNQLITNAYQPVTSKPTSLILNLSAPDDNKLVFKPELLIEGSSAQNSVVLLSTNNSDEVLKLSNNGSFSHTLMLDEGVNQITINTFDSAGNSKTETRTVYYSKEEIK